MISVIVPTYRTGGLDLLFGSLRKQTYRDFELILADEIFDRRIPIIRDRLELSALDFRTTVLRPDGGPRLSNYSRSINNAIARARGEIILLQADYTWLNEDCLERHAELHARGEKICAMLDYSYCSLPPCDPRFPHYVPDPGKVFTLADGAEHERSVTEAADRYERDLESGILDPLMWSIFETEITTREQVDALPTTLTHSKQGMSITADWASLKNESYRREDLLAVNGLDEDLDGSHLYQDQEVARRLQRYGVRFVTAPGGATRMPKPLGIFYSKRILHSMAENGRIMDRKAGTGERVNPHRDLRAESKAHHWTGGR